MLYPEVGFRYIWISIDILYEKLFLLVSYTVSICDFGVKERRLQPKGMELVADIFYFQLCIQAYFSSSPGFGSCFSITTS